MLDLPVCCVCNKGFNEIWHCYRCDPCEKWAHEYCTVAVTINDLEYCFCFNCDDSEDYDNPEELDTGRS